MKTHSPPRVVNLRFRLIKWLPVTRLKKIGMERKLIAAIYRHKLHEARTARENSARVANVHAEHDYEMTMLYEEEEEIRSNAVLAAARKLDIAIPPPPFEDDDNDDWQGGRFLFKQTLSQAGREKLRGAIRKEKKERHEARAPWLAWLTPIIALGGIAVTLLTRK